MFNKILMLKINKIKEFFKIILIELWIEKNQRKILMKRKGLHLLEIKKAEISFLSIHKKNHQINIIFLEKQAKML